MARICRRPSGSANTEHMQRLLENKIDGRAVVWRFVRRLLTSLGLFPKDPPIQATSFSYSSPTVELPTLSRLPLSAPLPPSPSTFFRLPPQPPTSATFHPSLSTPPPVQMDLIWVELGGKFKELLEIGRAGVVASILAASQRLQCYGQKCCQALSAAMRSTTESPNCIVPRILFFENYFICKDKPRRRVRGGAGAGAVREAERVRGGQRQREVGGGSRRRLGAERARGGRRRERDGAERVRLGSAERVREREERRETESETRERERETGKRRDDGAAERVRLGSAETTADGAVREDSRVQRRRGRDDRSTEPCVRKRE
ncbi:hypothetical protein Scep_012037 [Stephania cephalantha]|uniref:Uncharacterized protein n=1 Tax=Stephania cephalantha TaxID=152367 RepID=A0AAP0JED9_9MAGN